MSEVKTYESETQKEESDIEDDRAIVLLNDIKKVRNYRTRNRPTQFLNLSFSSQKKAISQQVYLLPTHLVTTSKNKKHT